MSKLKQILEKKYFIAFISILLLCGMFTFYAVFLWKDTEILSLPILQVENYEEYYASEGYMSYDISEIYDGNPWKAEWNITDLPVFNNLDFKKSNEAESYDDKINVTKDKVESLKEVAENFGITNHYTVTYGAGEATLENKDISLQTSIYENTIFIKFKKPIPLPFDIVEESKEDAEKIISYFIDNYKNCLGWEEAGKALYCDYSIEGEKLFLLYAYEKGNTLEQELLNYHFNNVHIVTDEQNRISSLWLKKTDLSDKIGQYPIITAEQAKELLYDKKYTSTLGNTFSQNMIVVKTELVYRNTIYDNVFMPCYKFFVQLPHTEGEGLHNYDVYYIPAIEQQYLNFK